MTKRRILAWTGVALTAISAVILVLPLGPTVVVARLLALVTIAHLIWRYTRLADWAAVEIGRSTMAIKGAILLVAAAANARSINAWQELEMDSGWTVIAEHGPMYVAAEVGIAVGWLAMSAALFHRDRLVVAYQGQAHALPAPPPRHFLPSEPIKEEQS